MADKQPKSEKSSVTVDTSISTFDLSKLLAQVKKGETWEKENRNAITLCKCHGLHVTLIAMHAGTLMPGHRVECPISVQVIEGHTEFITDSKAVTLTTGQILTLEGGIRHDIKAIAESPILLTLASGQ